MQAPRKLVLALALALLPLGLAATPASARPTGHAVTQGPCKYWTAPMYQYTSNGRAAITANVYVRCTQRAVLNDVVEVIKRNVTAGGDTEVGRGHKYDTVIAANTTRNLGSIAGAWCGGTVYAKVAMKVNGTWGDWHEGDRFRC